MICLVVDAIVVAADHLRRETEYGAKILFIRK
jgi:hypothetical protein